MSVFKFDPNKKNFSSHLRFMYDSDIEKCKNDQDDVYIFVEKPECIPAQAVREGTYGIRSKGYIQNFEYYKGYWIKMGKLESDYVNIAEYFLFPKLPDREYETLSKVFKYLSKEWQQNYLAYNFCKEKRETYRRIKKSFLKTRNKLN